jgi:hypothetical protein
MEIISRVMEMVSLVVEKYFRVMETISLTMEIVSRVVDYERKTCHRMA